MERIGKFIMLVLIPAVALMSCKKNTLVATITMDETVIQAAPAGGVYSVAYQLSAPTAETVEAICPQSWVNSFDYSVTGVISFRVNKNTGSDRDTKVTVLFGDTELSFVVKQNDPKKVLASELAGAWWTAERCEFDRNNTIFYFYYNPDLQESGWYYDQERGTHHITAGEFAADYAAGYNLQNPDTIEPVDSFLAFEYSETEESTTFYDVMFDTDFESGKPRITIETGITPGPSVICVTGVYEYDEMTGTMTVLDKSNTLYDRDVVIHFERRDENNIILQVTKCPQPDFQSSFLVVDGLPASMMQADWFRYQISNFSGTMTYQVYGSLTYVLRLEGDSPSASNRE